jgi:hypothetical protein
MGLCVCLAVAGLAFAQDKSQSTYKSDDGRLTFWSPTTPKKTSDLVPGKEQKTYRRTTYAVQMPNYLLLASVLDLGDDPPTTGDEQAYLGSMVESLTANMGEQFVLDPREGQTRLHYGGNGFPGRQVKGTLEGQQLIIRSFVAPRRIYTFQVGYQLGDQKAAADGQRFLASVVINDS